jgi:heme exporter protein A
MPESFSVPSPSALQPSDYPAAPALEVRGLTRRFGPVHALRGIDFMLARGDALAVFGPNGAGKTTLLRVVAGLVRPGSGEVRLYGEPMVRGAGEHRRRVGFISHHSFLYDGLTARENLTFYARIYGLASPQGRAEAALEAVGLRERASSPVATFSRGMVQRLAIARALLPDPDVVLLDEPFTGLDQQAAAALRVQLQRLHAERRTVVLVTHDLDEGLELSTHVAIQVAGRFVEVGPRKLTREEYRARYAEAVGLRG